MKVTVRATLSRKWASGHHLTESQGSGSGQPDLLLMMRLYISEPSLSLGSICPLCRDPRVRLPWLSTEAALEICGPPYINFTTLFLGVGVGVGLLNLYLLVKRLIKDLKVGGEFSVN